MVTSPEDNALEYVYAAIRTLDPSGQEWSEVIRHTFDMIYNGQETGRYRWDQLLKTEKTHFGSLFEINSQRHFNFEGGSSLDFRIAGYEVDAKWSQNFGGWMLPPEVFNQLALVATANDALSTWSLGLVRVSQPHRRESANRDKKSALNEAGRRAIRWLWRDAPLPPNILLQLPADRVAQIFSGNSGTQRLNELFRAAEGQRVSRTAVATVAQQLDAQKRVRDNGGARSVLAAEGYLILSGTYYAYLADALDAPIPTRNEYVSIRVAPTNDDSGIPIGGKRWRRANPGEEIVVPAPRLPKPGAREWAAKFA